MAIESREAQQMEKAWAGRSNEPELTLESSGPALIGDVAFWRGRRNDFREYNTGETNSLLADWDSMTDRWSFRGPAEVQAVF